MPGLFSLSDLITPVKRAAFLQSCLDVCSSLGLAVTSWQPGDWTRTILTLFSQKGEDASKTIVEPIKGGFGDLLSTDAWADIWAKGQFDVDRVPAKPATTDTYTAVNASVTDYPLAPGELLIAHNTSGKKYRNRDAITLLALSTKDDIAIYSEETGTGSNAASNTIQVLVSPSLIGVTVTNPDPCLGADKETTPALIKRARAKWGSISPLGPKTAYDYVATTPFLPDGTPLSNTGTPITRAKTVVNPLTGMVTEYIATAAGAPSGGDVTIVDDAIHTWAEPWAVTADAVAATPNVIPVTYQAWVQGSNLTTGQIEDTILAALTLYFSLLQIGGVVITPATGKVYVEAIEFVIAAAVGGVIKVAVTLPAGDVAIADNEVPTLGAVTPTITRS